MSGIGTLNESGLHDALKRHYAAPGDRFEVPLDGMIIDLVRADDTLVEVQTGTFAALGPKFDRLLEGNRVLLVHPIARRTTLVRPDGGRRRSPKTGNAMDVLDQLVSIPTLLDHPNFGLDVVVVDVVAHREHDPRARRGRGGWRVVNRELDAIVDTVEFRSAADLDRWVPADLPSVFTTADLASGGGYSRESARKLAYCLRALERFEVVDRTRAGYRYRRI